MTLKIISYGYEGETSSLDYAIMSSDYTVTYDKDSLYTGTEAEPNVTVNQICLGKGSYTLRCDGADSTMWMPDGVKYSVSGTFKAAGNNETEPNNVMASAQNLSSNTEVTGFIWQGDQDDYYKFELSSSQKVHFYVTSMGETLGGTIKKADGTDVGYLTMLSGTEEDPKAYDKSFQLDAGTYYIRIDGGNVPISDGKYKVKWVHENVSMYRLYNPNSGEHFYTASAAEKNNLVKVGWRYEGIGWTAPENSNTPVYRLYNPNAGDHHYTMSASEKDNLVKAGWKCEGIGWYSDDDKGTPLYRQYNPNAIAGAHNYTTSEAENDNLVSLGWKEEGIGWYGVKYDTHYYEAWEQFPRFLCTEIVTI